MITKDIKNIKTIEDFSDELTCEDELDLLPPRALLKKEDYENIERSFTIISKYKDPSWITGLSVSDIQGDLIALQASQVELASKFSILISHSEGAEERLRVSRSKIRVNAKSLKKRFESEGHQVKITLEDVKDLSYVKTEDLWSDTQKVKQSADFAKFVYYAIRDHVLMLDKAVQRLHQRGE